MIPVSGSRSAFLRKTGSGSTENECGSETMVKWIGTIIPVYNRKKGTKMIFKYFSAG
jgi:hypothetical protein